MGQVLLIEREGPVYRCNNCNTEIAQSIFLMDDWLIGLAVYKFSAAYNVTTGEDTVPYGNNLYNGFEVSCVKCCAFLGWKEPDEVTDSEEDEPLYPLFRFPHDLVVPPPPPPQLQNPLPLENPQPQNLPDVQP